MDDDLLSQESPRSARQEKEHGEQKNSPKSHRAKKGSRRTDTEAHGESPFRVKSKHRSRRFLKHSVAAWKEEEKKGVLQTLKRTEREKPQALAYLDANIRAGFAVVK